VPEPALVCRDCGAPFEFGGSEQAEFASRGLTNPPSRCSACREARKTRQSTQSQAPPAPGFRDRGETAASSFDIICAGCGQPARVPFRPWRDRAAYCTTCYAARRDAPVSGTSPVE
jgi:CxxC-x17-CxxC domain-containing protein